MRKVIVVAMREYQAAVRTKTFIISVVAMPIFMGGSIVVQGLMHDKVDTTDKTVAIWDQTGVLYEALARAAHKRDGSDVFKGEGAERKKVRPRFLIEKVESKSADPTHVALELSERVRRNELFAFVLLGPEVVAPGGDEARFRVAYHSNSPTYEDIQEWLSREINAAVQGLRFQAAKLDPELVKKATEPVPVVNLGLVALDEQGQITKPEETNKVANYLVPLAMMMLMWMAVMMTAPPLMQSVLEEKIQRIAEVLLGSIAPFQLMMGKLVGIVGVSLTLVTIYLVGGFYAIRQAGYGQFFPAHVVWWFVVFQAMAVLLYGSLFAAIGAAVSDTKEAQNLITPVMLVVFAPMFVWLNVVREPLATFSVVASLFPPATPMLMVLRQAVPPGVPLWQPLLGVVLMSVTTIFAIFVAGRIFRVGILMQGKGANIAEMARWALRG